MRHGCRRRAEGLTGGLRLRNVRESARGGLVFLPAGVLGAINHSARLTRRDASKGAASARSVADPTSPAPGAAETGRAGAQPTDSLAAYHDSETRHVCRVHPGAELTNIVHALAAESPPKTTSATTQRAYASSRVFGIRLQRHRAYIETFLGHDAPRVCRRRPHRLNARLGGCWKRRWLVEQGLRINPCARHGAHADYAE